MTVVELFELTLLHLPLFIRKAKKVLLRSLLMWTVLEAVHVPLVKSHRTKWLLNGGVHRKPPAFVRAAKETPVHLLEKARHLPEKRPAVTAVQRKQVF